MPLKKAFILLAAFFVLFSSANVSFASNNFGKCSKAGNTQVRLGKTYLCVRVGTSLKWKRQENRGPKSEGISNEVERGFFSPTCGIGLKSCPEVNPNQNIDECKISDLTPNGVSQGFPRPPKAKQGKSPLSILVVPVRYGNDPVTEETVRVHYEKEFQLEKEFYKRNSYSRNEINFTLETRMNWIQVSESSQEFVDSRGRDLNVIIGDLLNLMPRQNLQGFDGIVLVTAGNGISFGGFDQNATYSNASGPVPSVYLVIGAINDRLNLDHLMGHLAYYLEDLYIFTGYQTSEATDSKPMKFEIMGGTGNDFSAYNRWLAGFILDSEVVCLNPKDSTFNFYLTNINSRSGAKLAVMPVGDGKAILFEQQDYLIHVYTIDTSIDHGRGSMKTIGTIDKIGQQIKTTTYQITLVAADKTGSYISVSK